MAFKDSKPQFQIVDLGLIDPDPSHIRQSINEDALKGLSQSIQKHGLIHPLIVCPGQNGRYVVAIGERRRLAAIEAGETTVPVIVHHLSADELLEVRVFENLGLGVRSALEPRDMANAIQGLAKRFSSLDDAARYFGRSPTWLTQATAAANLSEKVTALLDTGKIGSTSAAVQLEKLAKKDEAKAESLIEKIEQLPEGEKISKKEIDKAVANEKIEITQAAVVVLPIPTDIVRAPNEDAEPQVQIVEPSPVMPAPIPEAVPSIKSALAINPGKVKRVADLLGLSENDEEALLAKLIDEFLALKGEVA